MRFKLGIFSILFLFVCDAIADTRRHGRHPKGFGRQSGFVHPNELHQSSFQGLQKPNENLEYGGLGGIQQQSAFDGVDDEGGDIQQVSTGNENLEEFSSLIQQPSNGSPEAVTPKGTFIGTKEIVNGTVVYAFLGVPYALPPVGDRRFKRPEPTQAQEEPIDATHLPNACPQAVPDVFNNFPGEKMWAPNTNMSEDCLFLNIWVPETVFNRREVELAPVLYWIYGGGFFSGTNSLDVYNGARLAASQNIVVVNVQYRVGPLGFLYLEPGQGNLGLIDQSLGLHWTNQNIEYFGGNPDLVTAAGESAGAASVAFQLLSPLSKNYIKRAIITSGVPTMKYALKPVEEVKANSIEVAKLAGCDQNTIPEILVCLRNVDSDKFSTLPWKLYKNMLEFPFSPIIDGYFLPDHPDALIAKGKAKRANLIVGTVQDEGSYFILYHYLNYFSHLKPTSVPYDRFQDIMNELFYDYPEVEREAIIDHYTNWENPEDGYVNQQKISEAVGDGMFICPQRKFAENWANRGLGVYYYHLSERLEHNPWGKWMGVMHGDDIPLLFGIPEKYSGTATDKDKQLIENFMELVGNFMKDGVPSQKWERYVKENPVYLDVNSTKISSASTPDIHGPKPEACAFWNKLLPSIRAHCHQNQFSEQTEHPMHRYENFQSFPNNQPQQVQFNHFNAPSTHCSMSYPHYSGVPYPPPSQYPNMPLPQKYQKTECSIPTQNPSMTTEMPPSSTSTSCRCTVQEGPTSTNEPKTTTSTTNYGFVTPPPVY